MESSASANPDKPGNDSAEKSAADPANRNTTSSQRFVVTAMEEILELAVVGLTDDFYSLGGNSFQLMTLIARLNSRAAVDIDVARILREPTVDGIAHSLEDALSAPATSAESADDL
jgi:aryl carrier-like protein